MVARIVARVLAGAEVDQGPGEEAKVAIIMITVVEKASGKELV